MGWGGEHNEDRCQEIGGVVESRYNGDDDNSKFDDSNKKDNSRDGDREKTWLTTLEK